MSWKDKGNASSKILDKILPEYQKISEAPINLEPEQIEYERHKKYKSIDKDGDIYLIQNPAVWHETVDAYGKITKWRPKPELVFTSDAASKASENRTLITKSEVVENKRLDF